MFTLKKVMREDSPKGVCFSTESLQQPTSDPYLKISLQTLLVKLVSIFYFHFGISDNTAPQWTACRFSKGTLFVISHLQTGCSQNQCLTFSLMNTSVLLQFTLIFLLGMSLISEQMNHDTQQKHRRMTFFHKLHPQSERIFTLRKWGERSSINMFQKIQGYRFPSYTVIQTLSHVQLGKWLLPLFHSLKFRNIYYSSLSDLCTPKTVLVKKMYPNFCFPTPSTTILCSWKWLTAKNQSSFTI